MKDIAVKVKFFKSDACMLKGHYKSEVEHYSIIQTSNVIQSQLINRFLKNVLCYSPMWLTRAVLLCWLKRSAGSISAK